LLPKNGMGISQLTTSTEQPDTTDSTENSVELINSTKNRDEELLTISSALSGTTETSKSPASTKKVTTTTEAITSTEILSTIPATSTTVKRTTPTTTSSQQSFVSVDEDEILAASSSNPGVFRVTTTYGPTVIIDEDAKNEYNTFREFQATTESIAHTTEQQMVNQSNDEDTDSSGLGVITAVISVILVLSLVALGYVSKHLI
jgi:hypothetical protein